jgi:hypothetical protein
MLLPHIISKSLCDETSAAIIDSQSVLQPHIIGISKYLPETMFRSGCCLVSSAIRSVTDKQTVCKVQMVRLPPHIISKSLYDQNCKKREMN